MKINILFTLQINHKGGGGNQFLLALKKQFVMLNSYEDDPFKADVILFNSHHNILEVLDIKNKFQEKIYIHRIDGPMKAYNNNNKLDLRDLLVRIANKYLADGTIFQSFYSKENNVIEKKFLENIVCHNAPDSELFFRKDSASEIFGGKVKLIATSWSVNLNKGFEIYKWLDANLDFSKYDLEFVGNSPVEFKNIKMTAAINSIDLSKKLREKDIFISASKYESCSNSILEGLHSGLPCIAINSGSNKEIIGKAGILFDREIEIPECLKEIERRYAYYVDNISVSSIQQVAFAYINFSKKLKQKSIKKKEENEFVYALRRTIMLKLAISMEKIISFTISHLNYFFKKT